MGMPHGPELKQTLEKIRMGRMDGEITCKLDEIMLANKAILEMKIDSKKKLG